MNDWADCTTTPDPPTTPPDEPAGCSGDDCDTCGCPLSGCLGEGEE